MENQVRSVFVRSRLPWIIATAALLVYLATLNRWISLTSLPVVAAVTSKELAPPLNGPVHFLVTLPIRWLPVEWQPVALNILAAVCGALSLGLLARSVALLPHDRTREQRQRERSELGLLSIPASWAPPLFAALVCGWQLTFWEHATSATGEMLDLLLFAYVVRCLLEYRLSETENWLSRMALIYGIAVTNNYAMIGFFPLFLAALIWIKGRSFFEFRFVARMVGFGAAGLTLYLLLPLLNALSEASDLSFWDALRFQLINQKNALFFYPLRSIVFWASLTSLVPLLIMGFRWPSTFGDTSVAGSLMTNLLFRVVHGVFLLAGAWVALDAPFSARILVDRRLIQLIDEPVGGTPFLTFYYLGSLCLGYFAGYYLLVFGKEPGRSWNRTSVLTKLIDRLVIIAVWVIMIGAPAALVYKNIPSIRSNDGALLMEYAKLATQSLPESGAIALSDYRYLLSLLDARFRKTGTGTNHILVNTLYLPYPVYQQSLQKRFPNRWPELPAVPDRSSTLNESFLMQELAFLTQSNEVYYLHPSFGYFFEPLYLKPQGLIYRFHSYATNAITPPPLTQQEIEANDSFWKLAEPVLARLVAPGGMRTGTDARVLARWYSRGLNFWGVESQKSGRLEEAGRSFELALKLSPENISAAINRTYNEGLRAGKPKPVEIGKTVEDKFGSRYRTWSAVLAANGPIDEPGFCFRLGQTMVEQSLFRQAALQFIRTAKLDSNNLDALFRLANVYLLAQAPDKVLEVTAEIRARPPSRPLAATNQVELVRLEAFANFATGKFDPAEKLLLDARKQFPGNATVLESLTQLYLLANRLTNALVSVEEQLKLNPKSSRALLDKSFILIQFKEYQEALQFLDQVLKLDPKNQAALMNKSAILIQLKSYKEALDPLDQMLKLDPANRAALLNRAIASLQSGELDAAQRDYEALQKALPELHAVYFGLGEIAYQRTNVTQAIRNYEEYLKYAPPDTPEYKTISKRLNELKSASR
jgi:tetratricopeptide (TPR) repeat protein